MSTVWVVGSLNVDLVVTVDRFPQPGETLRGRDFSTFLGGKGGNQAMALSRLGTRPRVVARVGDDDFGSRYVRSLRDAGAKVEAVRPVADTATGTALIEVDGSGQNHIVIVPGANGTLNPAAVVPDLQEVAEGDLVLLQLEIPFETVWEVARESHRRGARVILDPAPAAEIPLEVLAHLTWVTPNEHEASIITGVDTGTTRGLEQACSALLEAGVRNVVIKAGARGAMYAHREAPEPLLVPGFPVEAVDTTAAGDSFNGGLAWALAEGLAATEAIRRANAVAALSVTGMGAQTAMPTVQAVKGFLERNG